MAAVTTKKRNGDMAVQLTFPTVFEDVYAAEGEPLAYEPEAPTAIPALPEGMDLQADWHRQKLADANRMAMAGVQATKAAERRFLVSHAGYYEMPKPVLGQRIFANPSNGNTADIYSARRDQMMWGSGGGEGLVGGVLRTAEGQNFGRQLLQARVAQLDAIDAAKAAQQPDASRLPPVAGEVGAEPVGQIPTNVMFELTAMLANINSSIETGQFSSIDVKDVIRALQLLFRVAPSADREDLESIYALLQDGYEILRQIYDDFAEAGPEDDDDFGSAASNQSPREVRDRIMFITPLYQQVIEYVAEMADEKNLTRLPKERLALSKALVKKYGLRDITKAKQLGQQALGEDIYGYEDVGPPPEDAEFVALGKMHGGAQHAVVPMSSTFTRQAPTREDEEHAAEASTGYFGEGDMKPRRRVRGGEGLRNAVHFDHDQRQTFGDRSGAYFHEGPAGDYKATPGMETAPRAENATNPFRQPLDNTMSLKQAQAPLPTFPQGTPGGDAEASQIDAMAMQMQGQGRAKKWIQTVAASMKKGAFTKQALRAHMTPEQFADEVMAHPDNYSLVTRRRAQFLKNIRRGGMDAHAKYGAPGAGAAAAALPARAKRGALGMTGREVMKISATFGKDFPGFTKLEMARKEANAKRSKLAKTRKEATEAEARTSKATGDEIDRFMSGVASAKADAAKRASTYEKEFAKAAYPVYTVKKGSVTKHKPTLAESREGHGKPHGLTRASLPKTREGYVELAEQLKGMGHTMRINKDSKLSSIRQNFIRKLGL